MQMKSNAVSFLLLYLSFVHVTICKSSDESATPSSTHSSSTTSSPSSQPVQQQPAVTSSTSLNIKCDYSRYYGTGCPDHQTTICDPKRMECVCRAGSIVIEGRCMTIKSIDEPCYSSKECETTSGAKCINTFGEIESLSSRTGANKAQDVDSSLTGQLANTPNIFFNLHAGYCQCPNGFYHHQEKGKCIKRLIGSKCQNSTECFAKQHSMCDTEQRRCICDVGFIVDSQSDQCKPVTSAGGNSGDTRSPSPRATPLCEYGLIWDQGVRKCVPLMHWESNRTWSALVWKVAVLCVVLVLLMMLASGIQRARQNDNLLNWSRALELYAARSPGTASGSTIDLEAAVRATAGSSRHGGSSSLLDASGLISRDGVVLVLPSGMPPPPPSYTAVASATDTAAVVTTIHPIDEPPSYEEAIRTNSIHRHHPAPSDHHVHSHAITSSTTSLTSSNSPNIIEANK